MAARRLIGYRDAVVLLGGDPPALAALDRVLGSGLSLATGGVSDTVLDILGAQGQILHLGRGLTADLRESLRPTDRAERTQRLEAAHTVLVVTAYFTALAETALPFEWAQVRLSRREQLRLLLDDESAGQSFVQMLITVAAPRPSPHLPYEGVLAVLGEWYAGLSNRLLRFVQGLAVWDELGEAGPGQVAVALDGCARAAVGRYREFYARLATEVPEFGFWAGQVEHQATRWALAGVESLLTGLPAAGRPRGHGRRAVRRIPGRARAADPRRGRRPERRVPAHAGSGLPGPALPGGRGVRRAVRTRRRGLVGAHPGARGPHRVPGGRAHHPGGGGGAAGRPRPAGSRQVGADEGPRGPAARRRLPPRPRGAARSARRRRGAGPDRVRDPVRHR